MAGIALDVSDPDVSLLYDINGLARHMPGWFNRAMEFTGEYGIIIALALLTLACWWTSRRSAGDGAPDTFAAVLWAPLGAGLALLANMPLRGFVERPRPFVDHQGLDVLAPGKGGYSFVSDHATLTMALAVGLFLAHRAYGLAAIGLALLEGFLRVYEGVHYPTDVIGGFALGTAVALLLAPLAMMLLTPLAAAVAASRAGGLVRARTAPPGPVARAEGAGAGEAGDRAEVPQPRSPGDGQRRANKDLAA
ncbi:phosphatase PAP2 family protein [Streptomyces sp. B1866]|uniref:phosphatase PAP2 family protein n=1 Tax=Streptomyces sp. B1866 TaxID=3075431 RepID=UPI002890D58C|nr:phosphatase PAP2 family protein [Streptomyces sp. B1866]MDT3397253.1 phosphatase PAP2 family protein [Streptomyces sp. B1866]